MSEAMGGEPYWVVIAYTSNTQALATALDSPTEDDARVEGERILTAMAGHPIKKIERVTGPFPNHVPTEDRERRPNYCQGCGLVCYCGNHPPTPKQTWWEEADVSVSDDEIPWECIFCGTLTILPEAWQAP